MVKDSPWWVREGEGVHFPAGCREVPQLNSNVMVLVLRYSLSASFPRSLPNPDILNPPKGAATSVLLYVLTKQVPASMRSDT